MINEGASTSLNDICYEQIKDNFYYGKFGEFKIVIDKNTGCFNATKLCMDGGKEFRFWSRLDRAKELIAFFAQNSDKSRRADLHGGFYEIKADNKDVLNKQITGQYVQKEFILDIASWISPAFYFKCSKIVNYFFIELYKKDLELKTRQINEKNKQIDQQNKQLEEQKQRIEEAEERALTLQQFAISNSQLEQTQVIYIATSQSYAKQNRFKVGGVQAEKYLKSRLATYNSCRAVGDMFGYTAIFNVIEERLKCLLKRFRDKESKEMYVMYYPDLEYIVSYLCDHLSDEVHEINKKLEQFILNILNKKGSQAVVPKFIETWMKTEQEEVEEREIVVLKDGEVEKLREMLITLLNKLPVSQTEITKKELFDKLKVHKNRTDKLSVVKEVIAKHRPSLVVRERKERKAKEAVRKYPK